ncbi:MAG: permease-like cell division protein FtsX [Lachnospiraceae bacterium]|nr:permease-like cell division protein FtsX [Lachnospiraceae bacterium]MDN4743661.1 permease-like cell division protein FtsX [Lachnospiraceae bacterium C1.1]
MRISTFFYSLGQGLKNIVRNKLFSLATIATIAACVFIFGLFYSIVLNFQNIVRQAQAGVAVTVFFDEGTSDERIAEIGEEIKLRGEVSKVVFVSAEEAWESFKNENLGEYVDSFGDDNPLENDANYEIYLNDVSMQNNLVDYVEDLDGVREVHKSVIVASMLTSVNSLVGYVSLGIIFILLAVSIFLISNTVSLGITVRREEIAIMKLIGATDFVVRAPFVFEGMILGLVGAALPLLAIYFVYDNIVTYLSEKFILLDSLLKFLTINEIFGTLAPISLGLGIGIGFLGSFTTARKHLRV